MKNHFRRGWTQAEDEMMFDLVSEDTPFRIIAEKIGRTRNACIGRWNRLLKDLHLDSEE
jgi:hypothetical protein